MALQIVDPTLTPPIDLGCRQPSAAYQHVDRRHEMAIGEASSAALTTRSSSLVRSVVAIGKSFDQTTVDVH